MPRIRQLSRLPALVALLASSGCATSSMLAWQEADKAFGPFGTEVHRVHAGPPTEERLDVALVAIAADGAVSPRVVEPPFAAEVPVVVEPTEPTEPAAPVGPSLASLPLRLACTTSLRADNDVRSGYVQPLGHLLYVPVFFASALSIIPVVLLTENAAEAAGFTHPDDKWVLPVAIVAAGTSIFVDITAGALIAYGQPNPRLPEDLVPASWVRGPAACAGVTLSYRGLTVAVHEDGSLGPWDEAALVHAMVHQDGDLTVWQSGALSPLPVPLGVRCALARDRGYAAPPGCRESFPVEVTRSQLPARSYSPR